MEVGRDRVDRDRCKLGLIESRRDCDVIKITNTDHQTPVMDRESSVVSQLITHIIPGLLNLRFYLYLYFISADFFFRKINISINITILFKIFLRSPLDRQVLLHAVVRSLTISGSSLRQSIVASVPKIKSKL